MTKKGIRWIHVYYCADEWCAVTVRKGGESKHWHPTYSSRNRLAKIANNLPIGIKATALGWNWLLIGD